MADNQSASLARGMSFRKKSSVSRLKRNVKELLFPATGPPVRASALKTLGKVLDAFTKYESTRDESSVPPVSDGAVFERLSRNLGERFGDDFPFYLILAHRVQQKHKLYQMDEADKFVKTCVKEFESLDEAVIANTLEWFTTQDNSEPTYVNNVIDAFSLLEMAFIDGMEKLLSKEADGNLKLPHEDMGRAMLWISCAMKCHIGKSDIPKHWETFMWALKDGNTFNIDVGSVRAIGRGMDLGQKLRLPSERHFTSGLVKSLIEADHTTRPFAEIREIAVILCPFVESLEVFISMFLRHPRTCCEAVLQEGGLRTRLSPASSAEVLASSAIVQGLDCLEAIAAMYTKKGWKEEVLCAELKAWLLLLIRLTDDKSEIDDFKVLLNREHSLSKRFYDYIEKEVIAQKKPSVKNVFSIYDVTRSPYEFLQDYLLQHGDAHVADPEWSGFFAEAVRKYPGLQDNKLLLGFLRSAAESYQRREESKKFVLDLLRLNIGKIFVKQSKTSYREKTPVTSHREKEGEDTFQSFLQTFVKENKLQEILFQETSSILASIVDNNDFQSLVLELLQREAILAATNLKGTVKAIAKSLMEPLYTDEDAPRNTSAKFKLCWDTAAAFCKEIPITDDLGWAKDFFGICENLGWIHGNCCGTMGLTKDDQRLMLGAADIPNQVDHLPNSGSVRVLYAWIQSAQRVLHKWSSDLKSRNLTLQDVSSYKKGYNLIRRVAVGVSANQLLITNTELKDYIEAHSTVSKKLAGYLICQVPDHPEIRWCPLPELFLKYDGKLPQDLLAEIDHLVTFPSESVPFEALKEQDLLKPSAKLSELESLLSHLEATLNPVLPHIPKLLFFCHFPSKIVITCLKYRMSQKHQDTHTVDIWHFATSFDATVKLLAELVKGGLTYSSIGAAGLSDLGNIDFDNEFLILDRYIQYVNPSLVSTEGLRGIKCMLQLFLLPNHINTIRDVCEQYQLSGCTSDPAYKELVSMAAELSEDAYKHSLTPLLSINKMARVMDVLCLNGKISWKFVDLFTAVAESQAFYRFIVEDKEFVGEAGRNRFEQQYKLINSYLQHEEYNDVVCNHLKEAFLYILPFTDKGQDFHSLMTEVGKLGAPDGYKQLQTVNRNIHLIQRWFSRLEKNQPPDVISAEFESVLSSGCFEFTSTASCPILVILRFKNSSGTNSVWSDHEIRKFVRDLQLSDPVGDSKERVDRFLCLHETVQKIFKMHQELRSLAHPDYLQQMDKQILQCTCTPKEAEEKVAAVAHSLSEWKKEEAGLHKSYPQLLFFSMAKLVHLSQMLSDINVESLVQKISYLSLVQEISYLFQPSRGPSKDPAEREKTNNMKELEEQVKTLLERSQREQNEGASLRNPLHTLGFVVSELIHKYGLRSRSRTLHNPPQSVLYVCTGCTQSQLISLIVSIYGGAPEVYEILHCQPSTSRKELDRFINPSRHALHKRKPSTYLLLEVNLLPCELQEMLLQAERPRQVSNTDQLTSIGFITTGPSSLDNMIAYTKYYNANSSPDIDEMKCLCSISKDSIGKIELVYGNAGDGKSSYIDGQLKICPRTLCVIINEAFTISGAIEALNQQTLDESHCGIWFNFTLLPPGESVDETERKTYKELMNTIGWFFFRLFIIGYVEDPVSGKSFSLPSGLSLEIYVEVPSMNDLSDSESLARFQEQLPTLKILGNLKNLGRSYQVSPSIPYAVDSNVQLVCRYLKALKTKRVIKKDTPLADADCHALLDAYIPENMKLNKSLQKLFIKYMTHRCVFLDSCEESLRDKPDLRAVLLKTMLSEISGFCDPDKPYHQLVYDVQNKNADFILMTLHPDQLSSEDLDQFKKVGIRIPSVIDLCQRELLDLVLARTIGLPLNEKGHLTVIDESSYVLTSDFVVKMLNIHERARCRVPVVIEGETGVGKTALIEMMSKLWNLAVVQRWSRERGELLELIRHRLQEVPLETPDGKELVITEEQLLQLGNQQDPGAPNGYFYSRMRNKIVQMKSVLCLLEPAGENDGFSLSDLDHLENTPKAIARLAYTILHASIRKTFHKLNVHSGLKPAHIKEFFEKVFKQAKEMHTLESFVTVFLDEVNTSSCLGLLKEIIVDRTLEGVPVPENVFVISACNPHHGNSSSGKDTWIRGTYYVRQLHPTLRCLTWDYGALGEKQEGDYFKAKLQLSNKAIEGCNLADFTSLVMKSQKLVRGYALEQLRQYYVESEASTRSRSCVSQRDIQRVFVFYDWLMRLYKECKPWGDDHKYSSRAILITLALVYYIRLDAKYRERYQKELDQGNVLAGGLSFIKTFNEELDWFVQQVDFPTGIPKTQALKENLFAVVACTMTHTPLIIVGAPGTSNISFDIALANLRGLQSKKGLFQRTDIFQCLEQQFYQCSHHTTSDEISKVFSRALGRQKSHASVPLPIYCVVFMNEAGFPEEKLESLKVLHYYLDGGEVSFVAISNHVLDAAKTNRAVSLYQPETSKEDLVALTTEALNVPSLQLQDQTAIVNGFCLAYQKVMEDSKLKAVFGIQDFIHFVKNLRYHHGDEFSPDVVKKCLEENFNGVEPDVFNKICASFLRSVNSSSKGARYRSILEILQSTLQARSSRGCAPQDIRYKMFVDPSEDGSLTQMLLSCDVLKRLDTRVYMCSDFPGDTELQKIQNIKAIQQSMAQGHTVVLNQTDAINDSFYDVFSRRFEYIDKVGTPRSYYANIVVGSHIRQCQVHPHFECVLVVKRPELDKLPTAFLGLFEKYYLSHSSILEAMRRLLPDHLKQAIQSAKKEVEAFVAKLNTSHSIFSLQENTLDSVLFSVLPPFSHTYKETFKPPLKSPDMDTLTYFVTLVLDAFRTNGGFRIPECSPEDIADIARDSTGLMADDLKNFSILNDDSLDGKKIADIVRSGARAIWNGHQLEKDPTLATAVIVIRSVFQRWLVQYMHNRLLQLVVPEAIFKLHGELPMRTVQYYFDRQHHFSLKSLIKCQGDGLQASQGPCTHMRKLLCFTRSSDQLIHQLPALYPSKSRASSPGTEDFLHELVTNSLEGLVVCRVSPQSSSFSLLNDDLAAFCQLDSLHTMLLVVKYQEVPTSVITHLRVMINEAENLVKEGTRKLFIVLLQCPPMQSSSSSSHLSLFSLGWDLYYLDTIGRNTKTSVANLTEWLKLCCDDVAPVPSPFARVQDGGVLQDAFMKASSKLSFGNKSDKGAIIERILSKGVRDVLIGQFASYWDKSTADDFFKEILDSHNDDIAIGVHDCAQSKLKDLFFDFVYFMALQMNEGSNLDLLIHDHHHPDVGHLFIELLKVYPVPTLNELKALHGHILSKNEGLSVCRKFPFFVFVSLKVEEVVDCCRRQLNQQQYCHNGSAAAAQPLSLLHTLDTEEATPMRDIVDLVSRRLEEATRNSTILDTVMVALVKNSELWVRYFEDYIHHIVQVDYDCKSVAMVASLERAQQLPITQRLARLHVYFSVHRLNLPQVVSALRPLDDLVAKDTMGQGSLVGTLVSSWDKEGEADSTQGLGSFVVDILFDVLLRVVSRDDVGKTTADIMKWYQVYQEVLLFPSLRQCMYRAQSNTATKFNLIHMVYILLGSSSPDLPDIVQIQSAVSTFQTLNTQYSKSLTVPELKDMADATLKNVSGDQEGRRSRLIMEGLLDHYFAEERSTFADRDLEWFMEMANKQQHWLKTQESSHRQLSLSIFKFHLQRLMRHHSIQKQDHNEALFHHQATKIHQMVVRTLAQETGVGPDHYIPTFYRIKCLKPCKASENTLMQQPLAHLYFVTVFERLLESGFELPALVRVAQQIRKKCEASSTPVNDRILLYIEEQATVQAVIQKLAKDFNLNDSEAQYNVLSSMLEDVNKVLDDDHTGGGEVGGHGLALVMCMLAKLGSFGALRELLVNKYSLLCEHINCLRQFNSMLEETTQDQGRCALIRELGTDFEQLYTKVSNALFEVHKSTNSKKVKDFATLMQRCSSASVTMKAPSEGICDVKGSCVQMAAWLCIFQEFWGKNIPSPNLSALLIAQNQHFVIGKGTISHMERFLEVQSAPKKDSPKSHCYDPIMALFNPSAGTKAQGLQRALLYFVTMAVGSKSEHWYKMFASHLMEWYTSESALPGTTEQQAIGTAANVEPAFEISMSSNLSPTRKPQNYSYPSHQFILWTGFASCCLWLLIDPASGEASIGAWAEKSSGGDVPRAHSMQHYCACKLRSVWEDMLGKLSISVEELVFLVQSFIFKLFVKKTSENMDSKRFGDCWEKLLQERQFDQLCSTLKDEFKKRYPMLQCSLLDSISQLNNEYPWFPNEKTLSNTLSIRSTGLTDPLHFLSKFINCYEQLQITGQILPGLVELYHWLHTECAHTLSREEANCLTISNIVKEVSRTHSFNRGEETLEKIKAAYNRYLCLRKGEEVAKRDQSELLMDTSQPLIDFLSVEDGSDRLYKVIVNMVELHNGFIKMYLNNSGGRSDRHLYQVPTVPLSEFNQSHCIVRSSSDNDSLLEMIRRRSHVSLPPSLSSIPAILSNLPGQLDTLIDLAALQYDIIASCIVGKPLLVASNLCTPFKFREAPLPEDSNGEQ